MIKKMAKILLPWFIISLLPNVSTYAITALLNRLGVYAVVAYSTSYSLISLPLSLFFALSMIGLVVSAIQQEKGNLKAARGIHIGFTCSALGVIALYYMTVSFFSSSLLQMYGTPAEGMDIAALHMTCVSVTILLITGILTLIGQLAMKKPSLPATLIIAGGMFTLCWIILLIMLLTSSGIIGFGVVQGIQIVTRSLLPFILIPMRGYWRTFAREEDILPAAEPAEAAAE